MSREKPKSDRSESPTPDDLAGTPVLWEEEERGTHDFNTAGAADARKTGEASSATSFPTADELAGVPVTIEGEEDLTVRPRPRQK